MSLDGVKVLVLVILSETKRNLLAAKSVANIGSSASIRETSVAGTCKFSIS